MREILIIVPQDGLLFEAAGIADIFAQADRLLPEPVRRRSGYSITTATTAAHGVVRGRSGIRLLADVRLADLDPGRRRDTVFVTGRGSGPDEPREVADWLKLAAPRVRRTASVCAGALVLAQTGLLRGRRATTHWMRLDELQDTHPDIQVERGPIFVQDGPYWTSAGASTGFDLALAMVEDDHGFALARDVAQHLVMFLRRPGNQSQFSRFLATQAPRKSPIGELQAWILAHLDADLSVERLAERIAMSPRHFGRVFSQETGLTPAKYVEGLRLEAARTRLEQGRQGIEEIAMATGFGNGLALRRSFERNLQVSPTEYRERFRARSVA